MKGFKRSDALATHMRIHNREKTFECPYGSCKYTFSTKAGLKYHTLKHKSEKHALNKVSGSQYAVMEQENLKYETNEDDYSQDLVLETGAQQMLEAPFDNFNYQEQIYLGENNYSNNVFDSNQFDNTYIQPINPYNLGDKLFYSDNNEIDANLTFYSTTSNKTSSNSTKAADTHLNYHYSNCPQNAMNCAASLINNTEDANSIKKPEGKLFSMMQQIVEENSTLKKKLDFYQTLMRGSQFRGDEQNAIF